jgi:hypothetical protein
MADKYLSIDQILAIPKESPPHLAKPIAGLSFPELQTTPVAGEWSVNEVLPTCVPVLIILIRIA